jgi:dihydroxyacetone kinase-like predicted kinase
MQKYYLEFVLNVQNISEDIIKNSLLEFGEELKIQQLPQDVGDKTCNLKIHIFAEDPTIIFDTCAQFGRIKSVKVNEE